MGQKFVQELRGRGETHPKNPTQNQPAEKKTLKIIGI